MLPEDDASDTSKKDAQTPADNFFGLAKSATLYYIVFQLFGFLNTL